MEEYLKTIHAENYMGSDDGMPDAFDNWLQNLDVYEWLEYAEHYHHPESFYRTVVDSPEWKLWEKHNEQLHKNGDENVFAVWDSTAIGRISPRHFKAFLEFVKTLSDNQ